MRWMHVSFSVLFLAACTTDPTDIRPTIVSADLAVEGERLVGTIDVHFESFGEGDLTIRDPQLLLGTTNGYVDGIGLQLPEDFDPVLAPGETRDFTFEIDDDARWSFFCDAPVTAEIDMKTEKKAGLVVVTIGAPFDLTLPCSQ